MQSPTNFGVAPCFTVTSPVTISITTRHPYKETPTALVSSMPSSLHSKNPTSGKSATGPNRIEVPKMSSTSRAWVVAASVAAVEALKDQGFCRWNYTLRSIHQRAKNRAKSSFSQASSKKRSPRPSTAAVSRRPAPAGEAEESMRKVLYLSAWGPY